MGAILKKKPKYTLCTRILPLQTNIRKYCHRLKKQKDILITGKSITKTTKCHSSAFQRSTDNCYLYTTQMIYVLSQGSRCQFFRKLYIY